jgi:hypothetical protein
VASIAVAKTCTIASELVPASGVDGEGMLMAPYPHVLMEVMDLTMDYAERPPVVSESTFNEMSKSVRQRWIRKLKKYAACLRTAHSIAEDGSNAPEAEDTDMNRAQTAEAAASSPDAGQDAAPVADPGGVDMAEPTAEVSLTLEDEFSPTPEAGDNEEKMMEQ